MKLVHESLQKEQSTSNNIADSSF